MFRLSDHRLQESSDSRRRDLAWTETLKPSTQSPVGLNTGIRGLLLQAHLFHFFEVSHIIERPDKNATPPTTANSGRNLKAVSRSYRSE